MWCAAAIMFYLLGAFVAATLIKEYAENHKPQAPLNAPAWVMLVALWWGWAAFVLFALAYNALATYLNRKGEGDA